MTTVINIGGTSRSGSTLLNLILSNDEHALSIGEVHALFNPFSQHHFKEIDKIKREDPVWASFIADKETNLYANIFDNYHDIQFIVDSSKSPF